MKDNFPWVATLKLFNSVIALSLEIRFRIMSSSFNTIEHIEDNILKQTDWLNTIRKFTVDNQIMKQISIN